MSFRRHLSNWTALVVFAVLAAVSTARAESDVASQVDGYLGSLDTPVKAAQWRALGDSAIPVLEQRAFSPDQLPTVRARACEALGWIGSSAQGDKLLAQANLPTTPMIVRMSSVRSVGHLLPATRAKETLTNLLQHDDSPRIRATAGEALTRLIGTAGCTVVTQQVKTEKAESRHFFAHAMKRCEKP